MAYDLGGGPVQEMMAQKLGKYRMPDEEADRNLEILIKHLREDSIKSLWEFRERNREKRDNHSN